MIIATFDKCSVFSDKDTGEERVVYDNRVKQMDVPWEAIIDLLMGTPAIEEHKHQSPMFSGWEYLSLPEAEPVVRGNKTFVRKVKGNLLNISLLIIDYDDELFINDFLDKYPQYEAVIYTSHSHHNGLSYDKFRVVIPLTKTVSADDWARKEKGLLEYFEGCDQTSFGLNRSFFLPCVRSKEALDEYIAYHQKGQWFDPDIIPLEEVKEIVKKPIERTGVVGGQGKILWKTLDAVGLFKSQGLYIGGNGRNKHLVTCPWDSNHSSDTSGTAIWEGDFDDGPGFNCLHSSCKGKTMYDVTQHFGADICRDFCETDNRTKEQADKDAKEIMAKVLAELNRGKQ